MPEKVANRRDLMAEACTQSKTEPSVSEAKRPDATRNYELGGKVVGSIRSLRSRHWIARFTLTSFRLFLQSRCRLASPNFIHTVTQLADRP